MLNCSEIKIIAERRCSIKRYGYSNCGQVIQVYVIPAQICPHLAIIRRSLFPISIARFPQSSSQHGRFQLHMAHSNGFKYQMLSLIHCQKNLFNIQIASRSIFFGVVNHYDDDNLEGTRNVIQPSKLWHQAPIAADEERKLDSEKIRSQSQPDLA
jgi:hypothetical protein